MNSLNDFIKNIEVVDRQAFKNLSLCFLRGREMQDLRMRNYDEAIEQKTLVITEVDDNGNVPELRFNNRGNLPVFIPEGTIIMGLKQSRTIRVSFVINQRQEIICPVACVEQGRWRANSRTGSKSPYHMYASLRASNLRYTSESLKNRQGYNSGIYQSETWKNINQRMEKMDIKSSSSYAGDIYERSRNTIEDYLKAIKCPENATGFISAIGGNIVGMDIFGNNKLLQRNYQSLMSGITIEAIDMDFCKDLQKEKEMTVEQFLQSIIIAEKEPFKSIGEGDDIRFEGNEIIGSALITDEGLVHLEAFREAVGV